MALLGKTPVGAGVTYLGVTRDVLGPASEGPSGSDVYGVTPSRKFVIVTSTLLVMAVEKKLRLTIFLILYRLGP